MELGRRFECSLDRARASVGIENVGSKKAEIACHDGQQPPAPCSGIRRHFYAEIGSKNTGDAIEQGVCGVVLVSARLPFCAA